MISMHGVPSSLITRNESWVRKQATALARRLSSNVERADLIQVGLIAVAQAALTFRWEGDADSDEAKEAFVRYAQFRVKGAMVDELRQMDHLGRTDRRKIKAIDIARERWRASHHENPGLAQLSALCGMDVEEIARLEHAAQIARPESLSEDESDDGRAPSQPATRQDEVEARVDTGLLMRRLEKFFAALPERERLVIDAYLGVGMTPAQLAGSLNLTVSRVSQIYKSVCRRIAVHFGQTQHRAVDSVGGDTSARFDEMIDRREAELAGSPGQDAWGRFVEEALTAPDQAPDAGGDPQRIFVDSATRWG